MRNLYAYLLSTLLISSYSSYAFGDLKSVCATVVTVRDHDLLFKSEASNGIGDGDCRTLGFSLVCGTKCPTRIKNQQITGFYYSDGALAGQLGRYYPNFFKNNQPRAYQCVGGAAAGNAKDIAKQARLNKRDGYLYLLMTTIRVGPGTVCAKVNSVGRNGSVP